MGLGGRKEQEAGEYCIVWNCYDLYPSLIRVIWPVDPGPVYTEFSVTKQNGTLMGFLLDFGVPLVVSFHLP